MATYQNLRRPFKPLYCDLQENKKTLSLLRVDAPKNYLYTSQSN